MQKNKSSLFSSLAFYTILLFMLITVSFVIILFVTDYEKYVSETTHMRKEHVAKVKETLKWEVEHYISLINISKKNFENLKKEMLKRRANKEHLMLSNLYKKYKDTKSEQEIKELFITALRKVRFPNNGYYFITSIDGTEILFDEKKELEGKNLLGLQNAVGVYVIQEMIEVVKKKKEGFYNYQWLKPNNGTKEVEKIAYIKLFEPYGWIIGTGLYIDDLTNNVQEEILSNIEQMKIDSAGENYIFIGQFDGLALSYPAKGKNMFNVQDKNGLYLVQELIKKAQEGGGFVEYVMPSLKDERNSLKVSYVQGIPEWQWYVGAGLYVDGIEQEIATKSQKMVDEFLEILGKVFIFAFVIFWIFFFFINKVNSKIKNDFLIFIDFFRNLVNYGKKIETEDIKFSEFEDMALYANQMLEDKINLEDYLKKYKLIVSTSGDFLSLMDKNYRYLAVNETYLKYFEKSKEELIGHSAEEVFGKEDFEANVKPYNDRALSGESFTMERWVDFPRGKRFLQVQYFPYIEEKKEIEYFVVSARDLTEQKNAQDKLKLWEEVFENTSEAVMVCDTTMKIIAVNSSFSKITGYEKEEALGKTSTFIYHDPKGSIEVDNILAYITKHGYWSGEIRHKRKNGEIYPSLFNANVVLDKDGNHLNYISVFSDITKIKESERKLEFLAHHDTLTNLPNRVLLNDRITHAVENSQRTGSMVAVCFIDLDNFKKINDSYGHTYGDEVLKQCAKRIKSSLRVTDTLSRIGGDEFILLLEHLKDVVEVEEIIKKVQLCFIEPFVSKNQKFFISGSIGISMFPQHGESAEELIKNADTAMYKAKDAGKNTYRFFTKEMSLASFAVIDIENSLKDAITEEQFLVYYQPQINLKTKAVIGVEALVRWNHPLRGVLPPSEFIKFSEDNKMIIQIGEYVLKKACMDIIELKQKHGFDGKVSINVSGIQIEHSDFLSKLHEIIEETRIEPTKIELEITESVIMYDPQRWIELLNSIKTLGVKIAIDDFGTGYSSLSYLRKLPIDKLKIDMSFVRDLPEQEDACAVANSIITLSENMKMITLAEGIETKDQEKYLTDNNCEEGQGYLYAKPMTFEHLVEWLEKR